jgi:hypothetical protein
MAAVFAGMTVFQLLQLAAALPGVAKTVIDIANEVKAKGTPPDAPLSLDHSITVLAALLEINNAAGLPVLELVQGFMTGRSQGEAAGADKPDDCGR